MKKSILFIIAISVILISGAGCEVSDKLAKEIAAENIDKLVVCDSPYIKHGTGCCLDQNSNKICDDDEKNIQKDNNQETEIILPDKNICIVEGDGVSVVIDGSCNIDSDCYSSAIASGIEYMNKVKCSKSQKQGEFIKPLKPSPQLEDLWIGSRSGIRAADPIPSQMGQEKRFYLWFKNSGSTTFNCEIKEYYDGNFNSQWKQTVRRFSEESMAIVIEPDPNYSYRTIVYKAKCYNLGEPGLQDVEKRTQISIDYK